MFFELFINDDQNLGFLMIKTSVFYLNFNFGFFGIFSGDLRTYDNKKIKAHDLHHRPS